MRAASWMGASPEAHAQRDDPLDHRLGYGGGGTSADGWSGRLWAVASPVPVGPLLDGGPGALKAGSAVANGPALLDHRAGDPHTSTRGQGCVSVRHEERTFRVWLMEAATPPLNQPKALSSSPQRLRPHPLNQPSRPVQLGKSKRQWRRTIHSCSAMTRTFSADD